jgi:peptidoglycan/LPS O-acetylase OafA/YrhL
MKRLAYIDGLRATAALMVLVTHAWAFSGAPALSVKLGGATLLLSAIPAVGYVGVSLFLVLSGFCLMWPFACDPAYRDRMPAMAFWKRRAQRIVPAYFASMVVVGGLLWMEHSLNARGVWPQQRLERMSVGDVLPHLLFVHNLSAHHVSTINGSYWSLALEFQLYLLFPLLFEAARRWGVVKVIVFVLIAELSFRLWLERAFPAESLSAYEFVLPKSVFGRWLDFACGMGAAVFVARSRESATAAQAKWRWPLAIATIGALMGAFAMAYRGGMSYAVADVLWSLGFAALVCWGAYEGTVVHRMLSWRWLTGIGVMSYSLYLLHQPLMEASCAWIRRSFRPGSAFFMALLAGVPIVLIAAGFYFLCEKRAIDYFAGRRKGPMRKPQTVEAMPLTPALVESVS